MSLTVAVGAAESRDDASRQPSGAKQRGRRSDVCNARQSSVFADMYVLLGASRGLNIQDPDHTTVKAFIIPRSARP